MTEQRSTAAAATPTDAARPAIDPDSHAARLSDHVQQALAREIRSGKYRPGDRLPPERELMETFGVGRPSIREALFALQRRGILELRKGERPRVTEQTPKAILSALSVIADDLVSTPEGMAHFNDARKMFEVSLARFAAENATLRQLRDIEEVLDQGERAVGDPERFKRLDIAFHRQLAEIPGNPVLVAIHDALVEWVMYRRSGPPESLTERSRAALAGHRRVADAIRNRDPDAAEAAMGAHLDAAAPETRRYVEQVRRRR